MKNNRFIVYKKTNGRCWYCGKKLVITKDIHSYNPDGFSVDHITPKSKGGRNNIENTVPCCRNCNVVKNKKDLEHFRKILKNKRFKDKFGVTFTEKQITFLKNNGFKLPGQEEYTFYFEKEGLK